MYRRRRPFRFLLIWLLIFLFAAGIFWVDRSMRTAILKIAEVEVVQLATQAIYESVQKEIWDRNLQYQDFVQIHKDNQGRVVFMQANTVKVTRLAAEITLAAQRSLQQLKGQTLSLPLGILTGTQLLANKGPRVKVTIAPMGTVQVNVRDKFEPAGINQTRHRLWLDFDTRVRIVIPTMAAQAEIPTQVPLAESIIVGEVPGTFVNISGGLFAGDLNK
ncbi:MAG: sporulation protein YunB [Armatimonadetes bacterium]|nr:sporulation protein YunB [Armatimonadota bacterium]